jgi:hypothetical protein
MLPSPSGRRVGDEGARRLRMRDANNPCGILDCHGAIPELLTSAMRYALSFVNVL